MKLIVEEYKSYTNEDMTIQIGINKQNYYVLFSTESDDILVKKFGSLNAARHFVRLLLISEIDEVLPA